MSKKFLLAVFVAVLLLLSADLTAGKFSLLPIPAASAANSGSQTDSDWWSSILQRIEDLFLEIKAKFSGSQSSGSNNAGQANTVGSSGQTQDVSSQTSDATQTEISKSADSSTGTTAQKSGNSIVEWFKNFINGSKGNSAPKSASSQQPQVPAETAAGGSPDQIGESADQINKAAGGENGESGSPYKLEANQFKKLCKQNTFILYWRKGGKKGRDMAQPAQGAGAGQNQNAVTYWQLPSCKELSECHCCCNLCKTPESKCQQDGWIFNNKEKCPQECNSKCDGNCKPKCKDWEKPEGPNPKLNRDCKCEMEGCPEDKSKNIGCEIIILDYGKKQVEYTDLPSEKPEEYHKATGIVKFVNGNGPENPQEPKSKLKVDANDVKPPGWITKLKDEKGKCCKCYQDGPPIQ